MSDRPLVTRLELDTLNHFRMTVTVERVPTYLRGAVPLVSDVPEDIRTALIVWLGGAA